MWGVISTAGGTSVGKASRKNRQFRVLRGQGMFTEVNRRANGMQEGLPKKPADQVLPLGGASVWGEGKISFGA